MVEKMRENEGFILREDIKLTFIICTLILTHYDDVIACWTHVLRSVEVSIKSNYKIDDCRLLANGERSPSTPQNSIIKFHFLSYVLHTGGNFGSCDCVNRHNGRNILEIGEGGEQNQRENIMRTFTSYLFCATTTIASFVVWNTFTHIAD